MSINFNRIRKKIIKTYVDVISLDDAANIIFKWAKKRESKYVCIMDTNVIVQSWLDKSYREICNSADLNTPDGAPLAFVLRLYGYRNQKRVSGPDLMEKLLTISAIKDLKILFYGSTNKVLEKISSKIKESFPNANIFCISPPFHKLNIQEEDEINNLIKEINPNIIFVGLGCPKQDIWIFEKKKVINSVFIGIGAAFDFYAETFKRAPIYMQNNGLEWLYRVYKEPKRLLIRYLRTIFLFPLGFFITIFFSGIKKIKLLIFRY